MDRGTVPVGSGAFWVFWKLLTTSILVFAFGVILISWDLKGITPFILLSIVFGIVVISNEELVYGYACDDGIYFRRYLKRRFVPWTAVRSIEWVGSSALDIHLKEGGLFRSPLSAQFFGGGSLAEELSTPPELVRWLLVAKPDGSGGIELTGPGL
jgi:hypothetical protein